MTTEPSRQTRAAEAEVLKLAAAEGDLYAAASEAQAVLADAADALAADALDAALGRDTAPVSAAATTDARALLDASNAAIDAARDRRRAAILAYFRAHADDLRADARRLRDDAGKREKQTTKMLSALQEFEGCAFAPAHVYREPLTGRTHAATTKTTRMLMQADALQAQAQELDRRPVTVQGSASGATPADVVAAVAADPYQIAPRLDEVTTFANKLADAEIARRRRHPGPMYEGYVPADSPLFLELVWRGSRLAESECKCKSVETLAV